MVLVATTDLVVSAVEELPGLVVRVDVWVHCPAEVGGAAVVRHLGQGRGLVTHELLHTHPHHPAALLLLSILNLCGAQSLFYPKSTLKRVVQATSAPQAQDLPSYVGLREFFESIL